MRNFIKKLFFVSTAAIIPFFISAENKTYTPWYTGPLIATTANNADKGQIEIQPYLHYFDTYGQYTQSWKHSSVPNTYSFNTEFYIQAGLTNWLDFSLDMIYFCKERENKNAYQYGDTLTVVGFQLLRAKDLTPIPSIRFAIRESFPTGKYNNLDSNKNGIDGVGTGSYRTRLLLAISKINYWITDHPISWRINLDYTIPTNVKVKNFNSYGGGNGTRGTVNPPFRLFGSFSFEFSFTQKFAYAMDVMYVHETKTKFKGTLGTNADGTTATMTSPASHQFSLSPALEYNFTSTLGIIGGLFFTIAGKNSDEFISSIFSVYYTF